MNMNIRSIALITPVFVTFFWAVVLVLGNRSLRNPGFYMACLMISLFLIFASIIPYYDNNFEFYILLEPVFFFSALLIFPIIFFYVKVISERKAISLKDHYHFWPALIMCVCVALLLFFLTWEERFKYVSNRVELNEETFLLKLMLILNRALKIIILTQVIFYLIQCGKIISQNKMRIKDYFSNLEKHRFNWISFFLCKLYWSIIIRTSFYCKRQPWFKRQQRKRFGCIFFPAQCNFLY